MFYLLVMAILVCFISGLYLMASGSLIAGIALAVLGVLLVVFIFFRYSKKKIQNCADTGNLCLDTVDCIK